jgi:SAM-dependent methyltransferase
MNVDGLFRRLLGGAWPASLGPEPRPGETVDHYAYRLACESISPDQWGGHDTFGLFRTKVLAMEKPRILELGTRRSSPDTSTMHKRLFPNAGEYLGTDIEMGVDVDFTADVHRLTQVTGEESFDAIVTDACFEHFKYPHLAAHEVMKALRVGGLVFVQTHQTFPIHAVPYDYCRFSTEALRSLFGTAMGMKVHAANYASPAAIYSRVDPGSRKFPAYLHVNVFAEKVAPTPAGYVYEFDCEP